MKISKIIILVVTAAAIYYGYGFLKNTNFLPKSGPQTVISNDGRSEVTVPDGWTNNLSGFLSTASIQLENSSAEQYFGVVPELTNSWSEEISSREYTDRLIKYYEDPKTTNSFISNRSISGNKTVSINGKQAGQFEMTGTIENIRVNVIVTVVKGRWDYYKIYAWSPAAKFNQNKSALLSVVNTFKERELATSPPQKR